MLSSINKLLKKEIRYETYRHTNYMSYRKSIKRNEDKISKAALKQVYYVSKKIRKTKDYKLKLLERMK